MRKKLFPILVILSVVFTQAAAQTQTASTAQQSEKKVEIAKLESEPNKSEKEPEDRAEKAKKDLQGIKYRLIQDNGFFVDGAFTQEENQLQHTFKFERSFNGEDGWRAVFEEELPLGNERHELSFTVPASGFKSEENGSVRGVGDVEIEYRYLLFGGEASRVSVAPTFGVSLPTGAYRRELGSGGFGTEFSVPVSVAWTNRFMTHTNPAISFYPSARNFEGERAAATNFEIGQSFVWLAKPKFNALVELVWERNKKVVGSRLTETEHEFFVSPGVRWAHTFRSGLTIVPGIALPIGAGPSRGENGIFFYLAVEHPFKKSSGK